MLQREVEFSKLVSLEKLTRLLINFFHIGLSNGGPDFQIDTKCR